MGLLALGWASAQVPGAAVPEPSHPRPVEGWLSGTLWRPWVPWEAGSHIAGADRLQLMSELAALRRQVLRSPSADARRRLARGALRLGALERWWQAIERATEDDPYDPELLIELTAARLAAAHRRDRPMLQLAALETAEAAVALAPDEPGARFNRALTLERLALRAEAVRAWNEFLEVDHDSLWAAEARRRRAALGRLGPWQEWRRLADRWRQAPAIVTREAEQARRHRAWATRFLVEELLPLWGRGAQVGRGDPAALGAARTLAAVLAEQPQNVLAQAVSDALREMTDRSRQRLATAFVDYGTGRELRRQRDCDGALPRFAAAFEDFEVALPAMAHEAELERLICLSFADGRRAADGLLALRDRLGRNPDPSLVGRLEYMRGLRLMDRGDPEALDHYRVARTAFERVGDPSATAVGTLQAEALRLLGQSEAAWILRFQVLAEATESGVYRTLHNALSDAVLALLREGRPELTGPFHAELVANALAWNEPGALAEALRLRSSTLLEGGEEPSEKAAWDLVERLPTGSIRERLEADLRAARGLRRVADDPRWAEADLSDALAVHRRFGHLEALPSTLLARARARRALDDTQGALDDLSEALSLIEERRGLPEAEALRVSYFETAQAVYDEMIAVQVFDLDAPWDALRYAERSRSRGLLDRLAPAAGLLDPASLTGRLEPGTVVLMVAQLPDHLIHWRLGGEEDWTALPVSRSSMEGLLARLRRLVDPPAGAEGLSRDEAAAHLESVLTELHGHLIEPLLNDLPPGVRLVFVPDRGLAEVPLAALYDARSRRYLIQDHALTTVPSLGFLRHVLDHRAVAEVPKSALVLGDPDFSRRRFPLGSLPQARPEAEEVATLYGEGATLLLGSEATRPRFFSELGHHPVVHVAAHGLGDPVDPGRSLLALAPGPDDDGAVRADEIADLRLPGLDLVVLAACDSLAVFPKGGREGVAGLARGFLAAGVSAVVASLWAAEDRATRRIAVELHRRLVAGERPSDALRQAQLPLLDSEDFRSPVSWAGIQLIGDLVTVGEVR